MTFLEIQREIVQSRKAKKGVKNRIDYFGENFAEEKFYKDVYRKALSAANKVVDHCFECEEIEPFSVVWGKPKKEKKEKDVDDKKYLEMKKKVAELEKKCKDLSEFSYNLTNKNLELAEQIIQLKSKLEKYKHGGRKDDKEKESKIITYKNNSPTATVREIAAALQVSTRTVQKVLVNHGMNGRNKQTVNVPNPESGVVNSELKKAQKRFLKVLKETGDFGFTSDTPDSIAKMTMVELLESADCQRDNHYNQIHYDDTGYESKAYQKYKRFIEYYKKIKEDEGE